MGIYYSPLFGELNPGSKVIHPETGEQYGSTDWENSIKLFECQALPLIESEGDVPENPVQTGVEIKLSNDGLSYLKTKLWRSKTQEELDNEFAMAKENARKNVNNVRTKLLEALTIEMDGNKYDADTVTRFNLLGSVFSMLNGISDPVSGMWRTTDNQNVTLTLAQFKTLGGLMKTAAEQLYGISWQLKDAVIAGWTSIEQAKAFNAYAAFALILNPLAPEPEPEPEP